MSVVLRPMRPDDDQVLTEMFVAVRRAPFDESGLDPASVTTLLRHQAELQAYGYERAYPDAVWETITLDGEPVGRLVTDTTAERIVLVDIFVAPEHQARGIGSLVLGAELERAGRRPIELRVARDSPAAAWYSAFGFEAVGSDDLQLSMARPGKRDEAAA
jgi:GNAT superfamily N-acetyltransferase